MSEKYIVACDGSPASERALSFAVKQAQTTGASILIAHVLEWSPYSFLTPEELEERHKRRGEELDRAKKAVVDTLVKSVSDEGVKVDSVIKYGHVAETLVDIAEKEGATQMFIGRTGHSSIAARVFGSVAVIMAQIAPVPCTLVP
ncbi:MAG: universal stress protein [Gammaproteobacteria bacterium]|nr:universal stress protein [Gammaproteobacteria bacterium]